jgi:hypothetical protein
MSNRSLEQLLGLLVAHDDVRLRLASDPVATVAAWLNAGFALTTSDIDGIIQMNATVWSHIDRRRGLDNVPAG